jgi:hypothetical protein
MEKTFYYQPHIRYSEGPVSSFFAVLVAGSLAMPFVFGCPHGYGLCPATRLSLYLAGTLVCMGILARMVCRKWREARFVVTDERLIHYDLFSLKVLSFSNVRRLRHFHFLHWFGLAILRGEKVTILVPFVVYDVSKLLLLVEERLRQHGRADLIRRQRFGSFVHAARLNDIVNDRIYADMGALTAIVPFVFLWALFGAARPLVAYLGAHTIIAVRLSQRLRAAADTVPSLDASRLYTGAALVSVLVYLVVGIVFRWLYSFTIWA